MRYADLDDKILLYDNEQTDAINKNATDIYNNRLAIDETKLQIINLPLASGWGDITYSNIMIQGSLVEVRIFCYNRSGGSLNIIARLPEEYRPAERVYTQMRQDSSIVRVRIEPNGNIIADADVINNAFIGTNITYFKK